MADKFLEVINISKAYVGVQALADVSMDIKQGEIHCLVGENGSGKSTLIKIVAGVIKQDAGEIIINGRHYSHIRAIDAIREGIQIIYQDLSLFPNLTVAENISLNQEIERNSKVINWKDIRKIAETALAEIGEELDLDEKVENISVASKQLVAISRAHTQNAKLIIMDEPTSSLTKDEIDRLFKVITGLKDRGICTLFVSHKLSEVFEISERVSIFRDGKKVGTFRTEELDNARLVFLMTGKKIDDTIYTFKEEGKKKAPLLEVKNLSKARNFNDISFTLHSGEILGITGLLGSGRTELALALFGMYPADSGDILINGEKVRIRTIPGAIGAGIGYLPEDRLNQGLFIEQSISNNIVVTILKKLLNRFRLISRVKKDQSVRKWVEELAIKTPTVEAPAQSLSGGNQQRLVTAKWLATTPKVFILDGPTIGVDIASKSNIHKIIRNLAESGMGIIIISDEIPEVLKNCNRVLIMNRGRIIKEISDVAGVTEEEVFSIMSRKEVHEAV
ncbi:MAG: sugar ABC transporter ATP-binding protein [Spirochaetes bacterium]|nr:sugar ABC transporter ATP-binding protein [Spirochaetota bacterium]